MTPLDLSGSGSSPSSWYVERNLKIPDFVRWVKGKTPGDDPPGGGGASDNPGTGSPPTRLRSVIGPPGCGKSMFLTQLRPALKDSGCRVLWMDLGVLGALPDGLLVWLDTAIQEHAGASLGYDPTLLFSGAFSAFLSRFGAQRLVLLVDSFEDIEPAGRNELETQVLLPFLFPPGPAADNRYVVIARRDEDALKEALLRWEDVVYTLEGLNAVGGDGPQEQIRLRLAAVAADRDNARKTLEWEVEDRDLPVDAITHIGGLDDTGRVNYCNGLNNHLTPNPYVNLTLLRRRLLREDALLDAVDYRACLESYVRRAGLPTDYVEILIALRERMDDHGEMKLAEYQGINQRAEELEALMAAGIVAQITGRYRVEPAVCKLVKSSLLAV